MSEAASKGLALHVDAVIYREENEFVAHALQLDLVVTAPTVTQASQDLLDVCKAQLRYALENDNLDNLLRPAPTEIWKKYLEAKDAEILEATIAVKPRKTPRSARPKTRSRPNFALSVAVVAA